MKQVISTGCAFLLLSGVMLLGCASSGIKEVTEADSTLTFVEKNGRLQVIGTQLSNAQGEALALEGVSLGWHNWWSRFYDQETIKWLNTDWNAQLVRAAIGVGPEGSYLDNPDFAMERLYEVVDVAIEQGMYVIVDWHSHEIHTEEAKDFFVKVATKYREYPNVIYEIYNEPVEDSWAEVKAYAEEIIAAIRTIDSEGIILVGCPHWDQDIHLVAEDPILGQENIMYTVHFYAATHKQHLRDRTAAALKKGIPVFISECAGMEATGDGPIDHAEWEKWLTWMRAHKLSWAAWSIADKNETCSMIKDTKAPVSHWEEGHLKEWGQIIRSTLKGVTW